MTELLIALLILILSMIIEQQRQLRKIEGRLSRLEERLEWVIREREKP